MGIKGKGKNYNRRKIKRNKKINPRISKPRTISNLSFSLFSSICMKIQVKVHAFTDI
jgi:hypothetical protein